ncbi:hypothetical protein [Streptomyces olivaceus]|uniref:hypothetical protein n=1 Tax=Streptomyces olivaceus TaxID=47716 RepID=UPI00405650C6
MSRAEATGKTETCAAVASKLRTDGPPKQLLYTARALVALSDLSALSLLPASRRSGT